MIRHFHPTRFLYSIVALCILSASLFSSQLTAHAQSVYGRGNYSACNYQKDCSQPPENSGGGSSTVETPSGLDVSVNLTEGQNIPRKDGYTIKVTPLNGQGQSFEKVEIYLNDVLAFTGTPDSFGEVSWLWSPDQSADTNQTVKIVIYDSDGNTTTKTFTVQLVEDEIPTPTPGTASPNTTDPENSGGIFNRTVDTVTKIITSASKATEDFIATLPTPLVYSMPYLLFGLLGASILIIFFQQRRELSEVAALRRFAAQQKRTLTAKESFLRLSSHYLRTPLAVMDGGLGLINTQATKEAVPSAPVSAAGTIKSAITTLKQTIESTLSKATATLNSVESTPRKPRVFRKPSFWLPLTVSAILSIGFTILANRADALQPSLINTLTQTAVFILLGIGLYTISRHAYLYREDHRIMQQLTDQWGKVSTAQDEVIASDTASLQAANLQIGTALKSLPESQGSGILAKGHTAFSTTLRKLLIASHLRGATSSEPFKEISLSGLTGRVEQNLASAIKAKGIRIAIQGDTLYIQQPELFGHVLQTLLDNAIAYSPANSEIRIEQQSGEKSQIITITDQGTGIPKDKVDILFRPFERIEDATQFDREGMGFSLYLDQLIITYLGGTITVDSSTPKGTTIRLELPLPPQSTKK